MGERAAFSFSQGSIPMSGGVRTFTQRVLLGSSFSFNGTDTVTVLNDSTIAVTLICFLDLHLVGDTFENLSASILINALDYASSVGIGTHTITPIQNAGMAGESGVTLTTSITYFMAAGTTLQVTTGGIPSGETPGQLHTAIGTLYLQRVG